MAAESKDLFAFRRGFTDLLPNRSLDYARDDSLVRNLKLLHKLQFTNLILCGCSFYALLTFLQGFSIMQIEFYR